MRVDGEVAARGGGAVDTCEAGQGGWEPPFARRSLMEVALM